MSEKDQKNEEAVSGEEAKAEKPDECAEIKDRLLRLAAEFDNYKKRVAKDIDNSKEAGRAEVITRILPTVDEFELALNSSAKEDEHMKGMALIFSSFISTLKGFGMREIEARGKFDPYRHEIMLTKESDAPEGEILQVVRKGYMLNEIMLRPASVIISKKADKNENKKEE